MADMDAIRQAMRDAHEREHGTDDERMARFQEMLKGFLGEQMFQSFAFTFQWQKRGQHSREPMAISELQQSRLTLFEGTDGHRLDYSLMGKTTMAFRARRHVHDADALLKALDGWA